MHLGLYDRPFVPHTLMPSHVSPATLLKFQITPRLVSNVLWVQKKEPKYYCLSKSPVNEPPLQFAQWGPYGESFPFPGPSFTYLSDSPKVRFPD